MITDIVTVNDGTKDRSFTLVSREGMNSVRRETTAGVLSKSNSNLAIKHQMDPKATTKPNRHLVAFSETEYDANGKALVGTVHIVITAPKEATDALIDKLAVMTTAFLTAPNRAQLLIGGN
jgi:hypothetical protein